VKKYCDVAGMVTAANCDYVTEVKAGSFPAEEHCYRMLEGEEERFRAEFD
jgi:3-methyl-2-oxobutanoate hydroxymethyltransferase